MIANFFYFIAAFLLVGINLANADIRQLSGGRGYHCTLSDSGLNCTYNSCYPYQHTCKVATPVLKNPTQLAIDIRISCAITADGVKCWNWFDGFLDVPSIMDAEQISVDEQHACVRTKSSVQCWGYHDSSKPAKMYPIKFPVELKNPSALDVDHEGSCAIADGEVKCWRISFDSVSNAYIAAFMANVPPLKNPTEIAVDTYRAASDLPGHFQACAITDDGVTCWPNSINFTHWGKYVEGPKDVPKLNNPKHLIAENSYFCVLDSVTAAKCWADPNHPYIPSLFRDWNFKKNPLSISHFSLTGKDDGYDFCFARTADNFVQCF